MKQLVRASLALFATLAVSSAFAANIEFNGYYEGYYLYNMNTPRSATGDHQNTGRYNDRNHNQFTTGLIELGAKGAATKAVGYTLDIGYGDNNDALHGDADDNRDLVNQGYLTVAPANFKGWSFDIGRFYSHLGLESFKAKDNWNFSRSLNYSAALQKWGEGVRTDFMNGAKVGVSGFIYNGSDVKNDNNDGKSIGARVRFTPSRDLTILYNVLYGPEQLNTSGNPRMTNNVVGKWDLNDKVSLAGELTLLTEDNAGPGPGFDDANWLDLAVYAKFEVSKNGSIAVRFEHAKDDDGVVLDATGAGDIKVNSLTGTLAWDQGDNLTTWAELRHDSANEDVFVEDTNDRGDSQTTVLVGLTYAL